MSQNRLYRPEYLKELITDPSSSVQLKKSIKEVHLQPFHLRDITGAVAEILDSCLLRYDASLDGLLLGYQNAKRLGNKAPCHLESSQVSVKIQAEFYIFQPKIGNTYKAVVHKIGVAHVGCLLYNHFNISLPISPEKLDILKTLTLQTEVTFVMEEFDLSGELPFFRGQLTTLSSKSAGQSTESKKSKKNQDPSKVPSNPNRDGIVEKKEKEKHSRLALKESKAPVIASLESKITTEADIVNPARKGDKKKRSLSLKQSKPTVIEPTVENVCEDEESDFIITPFQRPTEKSKLGVPDSEEDKPAFDKLKPFLRSLRESPLKDLSSSEGSPSDSIFDFLESSKALSATKDRPSETSQVGKGSLLASPSVKTKSCQKSKATLSLQKIAEPIGTSVKCLGVSQPSTSVFSILRANNSPTKIVPSSLPLPKEVDDSDSERTSEDEKADQRVLGTERSTLHRKDVNSSSEDSETGLAKSANQMLNGPKERYRRTAQSGDSTSDDSDFQQEKKLDKTMLEERASEADLPNPAHGSKPRGGATETHQTKEASSGSDSEDNAAGSALSPRIFSLVGSQAKKSVFQLSQEKKILNQTSLDGSVQCKTPLACSTPTVENAKLAHKNPLIQNHQKLFISLIGKLNPEKPDKSKKKKESKSGERSKESKSAMLPKQSDSGFEDLLVKLKKAEKKSSNSRKQNEKSEADDLEEQRRLLLERFNLDNTKRATKKKKSKKKRDTPMAETCTSTKEESEKGGGGEKDEKKHATGDKKTKKRKWEESKPLGEGGNNPTVQNDQDVIDKKKKKLFSQHVEDSFSAIDISFGVAKNPQTNLVLKSKESTKQTDSKVKLDVRGRSSLREADTDKGYKKKRKSILFGSAQPLNSLGITQEDSNKELFEHEGKHDNSFSEFLSIVRNNLTDKGVDKPKKKKKKAKSTDTVKIGLSAPDAIPCISEKATHKKKKKKEEPSSIGAGPSFGPCLSLFHSEVHAKKNNMGEMSDSTKKRHKQKKKKERSDESRKTFNEVGACSDDDSDLADVVKRLIEKTVRERGLLETDGAAQKPKKKKKRTD